MKIRIFLLLFVALILLTGCNNGRDPKLILDVASVINKTPDEVIAVLGEPDTTYIEKVVGKEIFCQRFGRHNIEIQYPELLSTDIVIYGPHDLPFTQVALKAFNVEYHQQHPSHFEHDAVMRWYDLNEFEAISFYNVKKDATGDIDNFYIYFKSKTR